MIVDLTLCYVTPPVGTDPVVLKVSCDPDDVADHLADFDTAVKGPLVLTFDIRADLTGTPAPWDVVRALVEGGGFQEVSLAHKSAPDWSIQVGTSNPRGLIQRRATRATAHWVGATRPGGIMPSDLWEVYGAPLLTLHAGLRKAWRSAVG